MTERAAESAYQLREGGHSGRPGRIVTFYSYKGGTGRTMALANVAGILASAGRRVLAVDWDLDSPGLHRYFHPFLVDRELAESPGLIDMVRGFALAVTALDEEDAESREDLLRTHTALEPFTVGLAIDFAAPAEGAPRGRVDFLGPGRQDAGYAGRVGTFDWNAFYTSRIGNAYLQRLRRVMQAEYDYVLIDSRTGLGDTAGICTLLLPDTVVNCFVLNTQAIEGCRAVAHSIVQAAKGAGRHEIVVLPVPMRVEGGERHKVDAAREYMRSAFDAFLTGRNEAERRAYWGSTSIPYQPFYAFEEIPAFVGDPPEQADTLLSAYQRLADAVTGGEVTRLEPFPEATRAAYLQRYERVSPTMPTQVRIVYGPQERLWADWVRAQLKAARIRVAAGPPGPTPHNETVVVLLSPTLLTSRYGDAARAAVDTARLAPEQQLVALRVLPGPIGDPFGRIEAVDLVGLTEDASRTVLFEALGAGRVGEVDFSHAGGPRFPGTAPAVEQLLPRNPQFTGRTTLLERLRDQLALGAAAVLPQALYGMGGVGKTQVALEFAHRFRSDYDIVWWASGEDPSFLRRSLNDLAVKLGVSSGDNVVDGAQAALDALRAGRPYARWLVIVDNAEDPEKIRDLLPRGGGLGHVLVTSRDHAWAKVASVVEVEVFDDGQSLALLRRKLPGLPEGDARAIAAALGGLPLAIEQAGAWLKETGMTVAEYLEQLDRSMSVILAEGRPAEYDLPVTATWNLAISRLEGQQPAAVRLLELCSFLSPEGIGLALLQSPAMIRELGRTDPKFSEGVLLGRLFRDINRYSLAKVDQTQQTLSVHRLVQRVFNERMSEDAHDRAHETVLRILARYAPGQVDPPPNRPMYEELQRHFRASRAVESADADVRKWVVEQIRYMWKANLWPEALPLGEQLLESWREAYGANDEYTLRLAAQMGNLMRSVGDVRKAYELDEDTLQRQRELPSLGRDHLYTLVTACNVGADLRALGRFREAEAIDRDSWTRFRDEYGEDNPETLKAANNLAVSLVLVGRPFDALAMDEETHALRQAQLGPDDAYTWYSANNLGVCRREAGEYRQSRTILQSAADHLRRIEGEDAPATRRAVRNLAVSLRRLGDARFARSLSSETLNALQRRYGPDHPDAVMCSLNLAADYSATGEHARAAQLAEDAADRLGHTLDPEHPFAAMARHNHSVFLRRAGRQEEAHEIARVAAVELEARLGPGHPAVLAAQVNIANHLYREHDWQGARNLDEGVHQGFLATLRFDHPHTVAAAGNLSLSLGRTGDGETAAQLFESALQRVQRFPAEHPLRAALSTRNRRLSIDIDLPQI